MYIIKTNVIHAMNRRQFSVASIGTVGLMGVIAGCANGSGNGRGDDNDTDDMDEDNGSMGAFWGENTTVMIDDSDLSGVLQYQARVVNIDQHPDQPLQIGLNIQNTRSEEVQYEDRRDAELYMSISESEEFILYPYSWSDNIDAEYNEESGLWTANQDSADIEEAMGDRDEMDIETTRLFSNESKGKQFVLLYIGEQDRMDGDENDNIDEDMSDEEMEDMRSSIASEQTFTEEFTTMNASRDEEEAISLMIKNEM